ncbi:hypothetical protein ACH4D5_36925 [Streptomyces sp. NPDC018029]|uniref:hypothetical protein n=1 Tax=Streptomyces sp. NPDC018029 TaxID=3365032 RepID=UPI0037B7D65A
MGNSGLWVAALTAGTAIIASWVTSRGNAEAARVQAEASAAAQRSAIKQDRMRAAHLAFIEQINAMGDLYRQVPPLLAIQDPAGRASAISAHLEALRIGYGEFHRQINVVTLDGGRSSQAAADAVHAASTHVYKTLLAISERRQPTEDFSPSVEAYWKAATTFIHGAREAGA